MVEAPDPHPYEDADLKDVIGQFPQLYCAYCNPPRTLAPSESVRCLGREAPCWKPTDRICEPAPGADATPL